MATSLNRFGHAPPGSGATSPRENEPLFNLVTHFGGDTSRPLRLEVFMLERLRNGWNRWLGQRGEQQAERHLRRSGLRVLGRNYRTSRGEIDLIARDGDTLVFVEVKTRRRGEPAEAVTPAKQRRLTLTALQYMKHHKLLDQDVACRFDVIAIVWPAPGENDRPEIQHIRSAFDATGWQSMFT